MKKAIAFDLDTAALQQYYPKKDWRHAYKDIEKFLVEYGFEHQQGSVYRSNTSMDNRQVEYIIGNLLEAQPWLNLCLKDCIQTNVGREYSLSDRLHKDIVLDRVIENDITKDEEWEI